MTNLRRWNSWPRGLRLLALSLGLLGAPVALDAAGPTGGHADAKDASARTTATVKMDRSADRAHCAAEARAEVEAGGRRIVEEQRRIGVGAQECAAGARAVAPAKADSVPKPKFRPGARERQ